MFMKMFLDKAYTGLLFDMKDAFVKRGVLDPTMGYANLRSFLGEEFSERFFFSFLDERKESKENQGNDRHLFLPCTCDPWVMFHSLGREEDYPHRVFAFERVP